MGKHLSPAFITTDAQTPNSFRFGRYAKPSANQLSRHDDFWSLTAFPKMLPEMPELSITPKHGIKHWTRLCLLPSWLEASATNIKTLFIIWVELHLNLTREVRPKAVPR